VNSNRAYANLKARFPAWDDMLRARETTIANAIRSGGLANQKAAVIKSLLAQIKKEHGTLDLAFLHDMPTDEASAYLAQFRGIGPKTIACTLLFRLSQNSLPARYAHLSHPSSRRTHRRKIHRQTRARNYEPACARR
jgi:endonuclease-3